MEVTSKPLFGVSITYLMTWPFFLLRVLDAAILDSSLLALLCHVQCFLHSQIQKLSSTKLLQGCYIIGFKKNNAGMQNALQQAFYIS